MENTKAMLRRDFIERRSQLSKDHLQSWLPQMIAHLATLPLPANGTCMSYKSLAEKNEVPSKPFEAYFEQQLASVKWCYPRTLDRKGNMAAMCLNDESAFSTSAWGIAEPAEGQLIKPTDISLVLVPLLAFDLRGHRVGYGKGYYDRFLKRCKNDVISLGISWFEPVDAIADINANDVSLKYCVTPQQLYVF
jgi:5-formyltetrahydrofolate cyclo-ligase